MNGFFLINKAAGVSTRDTLNMLGRKFQRRDFGTVGILDKFASGLLIVLVGEGNKLADYFHVLSKKYAAEMTLFKKTDTLDSTGVITDVMSPKEIKESEITVVLRSFLGKSSQEIPAFSNKKIAGTRLSSLTRQNIEITPLFHEIEIFDIALKDFDGRHLSFEVEVSKGTYIRQLAFDVAVKLKTIGFLATLVRTKIGHYSLEMAKNVAEITTSDLYELTASNLDFLPQMVIDKETASLVLHGRAIKLSVTNNIVILFSKEDRPLAIYQKGEDGRYYSKRGFSWK
ncbi:MAG: tRNA pseudouridine(55) synthase TruB [Erysipelotrichaceae bacterium]|jgi:tRNA pseudouridine55 synthase|nr:tRNA pseudouridine(55) synthase TruB [Erysipelotrichaceae bacterium]